MIKEETNSVAPGSEPLADILCRVANELRKLQKGATGIDDAVSNLLQADTAFSREQVQNLQFLDLLCQSLDCLAHFLENMSDNMDPKWKYDPRTATATLLLYSIAAHLSEPNSLSSATKGTEKGECTFF